MAAGLVLPTIAGIDFSNSEINVNSGYVQVGVAASKELFDAIFVNRGEDFTKEAFKYIYQPSVEAVMY